MGSYNKMKLLLTVVALVFVLENYKCVARPLIFGGGYGIPSPQYVRSATFKNTLKETVTVEVTYKSGDKSIDQLKAGEKMEKEGIKDHGSFTSVYLIVSFNLTSANGEHSMKVKATTIERHHYVISEKDGVLTCNH